MNPLGRDGESPDISQQHAPSLGKELPEWAINEASEWAEWSRKTTGWPTKASSEAWIEQVAKHLVHKKESEMPPYEDTTQPEEERPFDQDAFFDDLEEMKKFIPKKL